MSMSSQLSSPRRLTKSGSLDNLLSSGTLRSLERSRSLRSLEQQAPSRSMEKSRSLEKVVSISDTELLRAVQLRAVMRHCGQLLAGSQGMPGTYEMSLATSNIDDFLSHNWSTVRTEKFLTLAVFYNLGPAVAAAWSVGALSCALTVAGYLPWFDPHGVTTSLNAWLCGHAAFFFVFLFAQDVARLLPRKPRLVFFDKACISQRDAVRQRRGIENLAAFLQMSQRMVVVYTGTYLQRLWTVYELASFMLVHQDTSRIAILPVAWVRNFAFFVVLSFLLSALHWALFFWQSALSSLLYVSIAFVANVAWGFSIRSWQRHLHSLRKTIAGFSIRSAVCAVEADRSLVEGNIATFMACLGWASDDRPEEALDVFDQAVRQQLPRCLEASFQGRGQPYWMWVSCGMAFVLFALDNVAADVSAGSPALLPLAKAGHNLLVTFGVGPLNLEIMSFLVGERLELRGVAEVLLCVLATAPGWLLFMLSWLLMESVLAHRAERAGLLLFGAQLAYAVAVLCTTAWHYGCMTSRVGESSRIPTPEAQVPSPDVAMLDVAASDVVVPDVGTPDVGTPEPEGTESEASGELFVLADSKTTDGWEVQDLRSEDFGVSLVGLEDYDLESDEDVFSI